MRAWRRVTEHLLAIAVLSVGGREALRCPAANRAPAVGVGGPCSCGIGGGGGAPGEQLALTEGVFTGPACPILPRADHATATTVPVLHVFCAQVLRARFAAYMSMSVWHLVYRTLGGQKKVCAWGGGGGILSPGKGGFGKASLVTGQSKEASLNALMMTHHQHHKAARKRFFFKKKIPHDTYLTMISASWGMILSHLCWGTSGPPPPPSPPQHARSAHEGSCQPVGGPRHVSPERGGGWNRGLNDSPSPPPPLARANLCSSTLRGAVTKEPWDPRREGAREGGGVGAGQGVGAPPSVGPVPWLGALPQPPVAAPRAAVRGVAPLSAVRSRGYNPTLLRRARSSGALCVRTERILLHGPWTPLSWAPSHSGMY